MRRMRDIVIAFLFLLAAIAPAPALAVNPAAGTAGARAQERIRRIENGFAPIQLAPGEKPVRLTLQQLIALSNVSALSIAVVDHDRVDWAKGYGTTRSGQPVTAQTLFPACSISKPVAALAALQLVDEGRLSLDEDVNRGLRSWHVPENEFTREEKVTLRRILTHTAGTLDRGFPGYAPGEPQPTLLQVLDGTAPANTAPVCVAYTPGTRQSYSGSGFLVLQQLMVDVCDRSFPRIVQERVLDPLGLTHSRYGPPPPSLPAVTGRDRNGEPLPTLSGPELAVGGLWTTPSELARIGIEVARARRGESSRILSPAMAREMLRVQVNPGIDGAPAGGPETRTGLGWFLGEGADPSRFEHSGVNYGFAAKLVMWDSGRGVVVMANNWSFETECLLRYVINAVATEYGWTYRVPSYTPWPYADTVLLAAAKLRGVNAAIAMDLELKRRSAEQKAKGRGLDVVWASDPPDYAPNEWDLYGLAQALADPRHLEDAIAVMKVEVEEYPRWATAYSYLGQLYAGAGQVANAVAAYEALLQLVPGDPDATAALAKLRAPAGRR